jgi:exosortase/archaeosortase
MLRPRRRPKKTNKEETMITARTVTIIVLVLACTVIPVVSVFGGGRREELTDPEVISARTQDLGQIEQKIPYLILGTPIVHEYNKVDNVEEAIPYLILGSQTTDIHVTLGFLDP